MRHMLSLFYARAAATISPLFALMPLPRHADDDDHAYLIADATPRTLFFSFLSLYFRYFSLRQRNNTRTRQLTLRHDAAAVYFFRQRLRIIFLMLIIFNMPYCCCQMLLYVVAMFHYAAYASRFDDDFLID